MVTLVFNDLTHYDDNFQSNLKHSSRFEATKNKNKAISSLETHSTNFL